MVLHLVLEPSVDISKIGSIALREGANVGAKIGEHMSPPDVFVFELLSPEAKGTFDLFAGSFFQLIKLGNFGRIYVDVN
jgi:hypothetical protein